MMGAIDPFTWRVLLDGRREPEYVEARTAGLESE